MVAALHTVSDHCASVKGVTTRTIWRSSHAHWPRGFTAYSWVLLREDMRMVMAGTLMPDSITGVMKVGAVQRRQTSEATSASWRYILSSGFTATSTSGLRVTSGHLDRTSEKRGCVSNHVENLPVVFEVWNFRVQKNYFQLVLVTRLQTGLQLLNSELIWSDTE